MKIAVPDVISNSYFPAAAAVELGFFKQEGLDVSLELIFPVDQAYVALRDGAVDFVGGSANRRAAFQVAGRQLLCAQAQGMYWFLVMDKKPAPRGARRGQGCSIGAPLGRDGLRRLLAKAGIDLQRGGVTTAPVPGAPGLTNFGVTAARPEDAR